jgi:hypothetical protein
VGFGANSGCEEGAGVEGGGMIEWLLFAWGCWGLVDGV